MPGFGTPLPDGFDCTKDAYVAWLIARVEEVGEPVDIVGHDWGCILVQRLVSLRPDLVRTWAVGSAALDPEYVWHDTAKTWQTPDVGEQLMAAFTPDVMAGVLASQGIPADVAKDTAARIDEQMKTSILALYRSAINVGHDWAPLALPTPPGLVIWGADDPYVGVEFGQRLVDRTGAKFVPLAECGHWWPAQRPSRGVARRTLAALSASPHPASPDGDAVPLPQGERDELDGRLATKANDAPKLRKRYNIPLPLRERDRRRSQAMPG